jgi:hypothetical protein
MSARLALWSALAGLLLAGCNVHIGTEISDSRNAHLAFHQTVGVTPPATLNVRNISGFVKVLGWQRPEVDIRADAYGASSVELHNTRIAVDRTGSTVDVHTEYGGGGLQSRGASVEYTIQVPAGSAVVAKDVAGDVTVRGVTGDVDAGSVSGRIDAHGLSANASLSSTSGAIRAAFAKLASSQTVSVKSVSGDVTLIFPASASADFDSKSVSGPFTSEFPSLKAGTQTVGSHGQGTLGNAGASVTVKTISGSVNVERSK